MLRCIPATYIFSAIDTKSMLVKLTVVNCYYSTNEVWGGGGGYVFGFVCVFMCVSRITAQVNNQPIYLKLDVMMGLSVEESVNFLVVIWSQIWIPDYFSTSLSIIEFGNLGDLLAFLIQSLAAFHET